MHMFDYRSGSRPEDKDFFDLAVDWMDENPVRWWITASWAGAVITLGILAVLSRFQ